ncbi:hypothetical protein BGZ63DRAFT_408482 [Mariannaea sp. PMI_226]|nr:hypothetical protein BGZ63DRAFT_408482 [Mariannaea sp. PMI_226]
MPPQRHHTSASFAYHYDHNLDGVRTRRAHRKSREGCLECKRRHVKCDEGRPSCLRCSKTNRSCAYKDASEHPMHMTTAVGSLMEQTPGYDDDVSATDKVSQELPSVTAALNNFMLHFSADENPLPVCGWPLTREHMALLRHAEENSLPFDSKDPVFKPVVQAVIEAAWTAPYLMDLFLALSALHLAELNPSVADACRQQAIQLQTRELMLFNEAKEDILPDTCLPMFLFSSVVGTTVLYEVLRNHRDNFTDFLDRFVFYLRLHSGVSVITRDSWSMFQKHKMTFIHQYLPRQDVVKKLVEKGTECNPLDAMLDESDLGMSAAEACRSTVEILRSSFAIYQHLSSATCYRSSGPMAFAARISPLFADLAEQRQPEALVIIAYYAVLLHWCRDSWVFRDAGEFMINGIVKYLGTYWQRWLVFPKSLFPI